MCRGNNMESLLGLETAVDIVVVKILNSISNDLPSTLE